MAMAMTIREYLRACNIDYEEVKHPREVSSGRIAEQAHVTGDHLAKAVMLRSDSGLRVAVVPSTCDADLGRLAELCHERIGLASESELARHFADCDRGAIAPVGQAYGLKVYLDDLLREQSDVYFEAGDHETLVHMSGKEFDRLMAGTEHGRFSHRR